MKAFFYCLRNKVIKIIYKSDKGIKFVVINTDQNIFENVNPKNFNKVAKKYILDNFRKNGIDFNNENISVTAKTAREYAYPKIKMSSYIKDSKMKASTELDNLVKISKYQYSKKDDGRHPFATDGWDYYKTIFSIGNKSFEGLVNIGKNGNKKTLYDITNLKEVPYISTSEESFSESVCAPLCKK